MERDFLDSNEPLGKIVDKWIAHSQINEELLWGVDKEGYSFCRGEIVVLKLIKKKLGEKC